MSTPRLGPTAYVVLGLVEYAQPATPYDVKQLAELSTANFWSLPHTQLYTETARLTEAGLLAEEREPAGRRRRLYRLTAEGQAALDAWRREPAETLFEVRDIGILQLFFGARPGDLATGQIALHEAKLAEYGRTAELEMTPGMRLALELGTRVEQAFLTFWREVREGD